MNATLLQKIIHAVLAFALLGMGAAPGPAAASAHAAPTSEPGSSARVQILDSHAMLPVAQPRVDPIAQPTAPSKVSTGQTVPAAQHTAAAPQADGDLPDLAFPASPVDDWTNTVILSIFRDGRTASPLREGQQVYLAYQLTNLGGSLSDQDSFDDCLYIDEVQVFCQTDYASFLTDQPFYSSMANPLRLAALPASGSHTVKFALDAHDAVAEADESNNTWQTTITWQAAPAGGYVNLRPYSDETTPAPLSLALYENIPAGSKALVLGKPFYLNWGIFNDGPVDITTCLAGGPSQTVQYQITIDNTVLVDQSWCGGLEKNHSIQYPNQPADLSKIEGLAAGYHTVQITIDPENTIVESDESDNTFSFLMQWTTDDYVDLAPEAPLEWNFPLQITSEAAPDGNIQLYSDQDSYLHFAVHNLGSQDADGFSARITLDGEVFMTLHNLNAAANELKQVTNVRIPAGRVQPGWHTVRLEINPDEALPEPFTYDNAYQMDFKWEASGLPNLHPYQVTNWADALVFSAYAGTHSPSALTAGLPIYNSRAVINDGWGAIPAGTVVETALTIDGVTIDGDSSADGLASGAYQMVADDSIALFPGWHLATLTADPENRIIEANEDDNSISLWIYVAVFGSQQRIAVSPTTVNIDRAGGGSGMPGRSSALLPQRVSPISAFDPAQHGFGAAVTPPTRDILPRIPLADMDPADLPEAVSHANRMPPVKDQGGAGSCTAWSTSYYAKAFQEGLDQGWDLTQSTHQFSPNFVWNQIQMSNTCGGTLVSDALQLIEQKGDLPLSEMPYSEDCHPQPNAGQFQTASAYRARNYGAFFTADQTPDDAIFQQMKEWIAGGGVIQLSIHTPQEFTYPAGPYCVVDLPSLGNEGENHAITIVGYNDNIGGTGQQGFQIINSWGSNYGCGGYAYLTYDWVKQNAYEAWWMNDVITGPGYRDFTIQNHGSAALTITSIRKETDSPWLFLNLPAALPMLIQPGQSATVHFTVDPTLLTGQSGQATLTVESDDPDHPTIPVTINLRTAQPDSAAPSGATQPNPPDQAAHQATAQKTFRWTAAQSAPGVLYDVRLDSANPPTSVVCNDISAASCTVSGLHPNTTYYWQVVSQTAMKSTLSPVWQFTTGDIASQVFLPVVVR
jgi:hypothetical protein